MPMYRATTRHPIASTVRPEDIRDVTIPEFQDSKSLGAALRAARLLPSGVRVREWRRDGAKIHVFPTRCVGIHCVTLEPLPYELAPIDVSADGQTLTILSSKPGQTIDAGDVVIETTLHRLG
jgi:hypothetical protein